MAASRTDDALPHETVGRASPLKIEVALLTAVGFVLVVNFGFVAYLDASPAPSDADTSAQKWHALGALDGAQDWLIVGDSTCLVGLDPSVLEAELGGQAANLCTFEDLLAVDDAWMLQRHIELYGPPDNVVMTRAYTGWSLGREQLRTDALAQVPLEGEYWSTHSPTIDLASDVEAVRAERQMPLWYRNKTIGSLLRNPAELFTIRDGRGRSQLDPIDTKKEELLREQVGEWQELSADPPAGERLVSEINRLALGEMARLADEHGFDLFIAPPPIPATLGNDPLVQQLIGSISDELREVVRDSPNVHLLVEDLVIMDDEEMWDASHVLESSLVPYSEQVAGRIASARGGS